MRILLIDHCQYITGALSKTIEVAEALADYGHEVTLIATSKTNRFSCKYFTKEKVRYILAPSLLWGKLRNGADLWDTFRRITSLKGLEFDLVHAYDCRPTVIFPALYLKYVCSVPLIHEWADLFSKEGTISERSGRLYQITLGNLEALFDTYFRRYADGCIAVSDVLKRNLLRLGISNDRILDNYHYGSRYANMPQLSITKARQYTGIPNDTFILAYAGNMYPKDAELFYRVLLALPYTTKAKMKLMIINSPLSNNLSDIGIEVLSFGRLPDHDFFVTLSAANAFILPYRLTIANIARWPSKFSDYCSIGRPIISTPVADLPSIYREYNLGILTHDDSISALVVAICNLVEAPEHTVAMGQQAKTYACHELRLSVIAKRLDTFYRHILSTL